MVPRPGIHFEYFLTQSQICRIGCFFGNIKEVKLNGSDATFLPGCGHMRYIHTTTSSTSPTETVVLGNVMCGSKGPFSCSVLFLFAWKRQTDLKHMIFCGLETRYYKRALFGGLQVIFWSTMFNTVQYQRQERVVQCITLAIQKHGNGSSLHARPFFSRSFLALAFQFCF